MVSFSKQKKYLPPNTPAHDVPVSPAVTPKRRFGLPWTKKRPSSPPPPLPTQAASQQQEGGSFIVHERPQQAPAAISPVISDTPQMPASSIHASKFHHYHPEPKPVEVNIPQRPARRLVQQKQAEYPQPPPIPQSQPTSTGVAHSTSVSTVSTNNTSLSSAFEWDTPSSTSSLQTFPQTSPTPPKHKANTPQRVRRHHHKKSDSVKSHKTSTSTATSSTGGSSSRSRSSRRRPSVYDIPPPPPIPMPTIPIITTSAPESPSKPTEVFGIAKSTPSPSSIFDSPLGQKRLDNNILRNVDENSSNSQFRRHSIDSPSLKITSSPSKHARSRSAIESTSASSYPEPQITVTSSSDGSLNSVISNGLSGAAEIRTDVNKINPTVTPKRGKSRGIKVGDATWALRNIVNQESPGPFADQSPPFDYAFEMAAQKATPDVACSPSYGYAAIGANFMNTPCKTPSSTSLATLAPSQSLAAIRIPSMHFDGLSMEDVFAELEAKIGVRLDDENADLSEAKFEEAVKLMKRMSRHRNLHDSLCLAYDVQTPPEEIPEIPKILPTTESMGEKKFSRRKQSHQMELKPTAPLRLPEVPKKREPKKRPANLDVKKEPMSKSEPNTTLLPEYQDPTAKTSIDESSPPKPTPHRRANSAFVVAPRKRVDSMHGDVTVTAKTHTRQLSHQPKSNVTPLSKSAPAPSSAAAITASRLPVASSRKNNTASKTTPKNSSAVRQRTKSESSSKIETAGTIAVPKTKPSVHRASTDPQPRSEKIVPASSVPEQPSKSVIDITNITPPNAARRTIKPPKPLYEPPQAPLPPPVSQVDRYDERSSCMMDEKRRQVKSFSYYVDGLDDDAYGQFADAQMTPPFPQVPHSSPPTMTEYPDSVKNTIVGAQQEYWRNQRHCLPRVVVTSPSDRCSLDTI